MEPIFFADTKQLREWFEKNYKKESELQLGYYKVGTGKPSVTWSESVDEALCFGWIDGVRRSLGEESYTIRFTPRKPGSIWSAVNIKKMEQLIKDGKVKPEGLEAYSKRKDEKSKIYSYEKEPVKLDKAFEKVFKANKKAWEFFRSSAPSYQKTAIHWVMSAKQEATRKNRFEVLLNDSAAGLKAKPYRY